MNNRSRLSIVGVLIVSLVAASFARHWAGIERSRGAGAAHAVNAAGLGRMNSYAIALLLGGLRGPLVMFLWPSAETQKQDKNLEDFDTKIEWIRLLQEEFDTVHIFQIWNKAYNISVQMANLPNKYRTILDALDYARSVDVSRPNNINILTAIGQVYFDKLANSSEKTYYREHIRDESQARQDMVRVSVPPPRRAELATAALDAGLPARKIHINIDDKTGDVWINIPKSLADVMKSKLTGADTKFTDRPRPRINREDPTWRRTELDPMLDAAGNVLPQYVEPKNPRPAGLDPTEEWNEGSELQYLKQYEPFAYGISPWALGYNYYKRAEVLQNRYNQKHAQLSESVVDSRPGLSLKNWAEEELERGRSAELQAFGKPVPAERAAMDIPTADEPLDAAIPHRPPIDEAIFSYGRAARLADDAIAEYQRHLKNDTLNITIYLSHMDDLRGVGAISSADRYYLLAMTDPAKREQYRKSAAQSYRLARRRYITNVLSYCATDEMVQAFFPKDLTRAALEQKGLPDEQLLALYAKLQAAVPMDLNQYQYADEYKDYSAAITRAQQRLKQLGE